MKPKPSIRPKTILPFLALLVSLAFAPITSQAAVLTVCPTGCDFNEPQNAIQAAQAGDEIKVSAGTYTQSLTFLPATPGPLTIRGGYDPAGCDTGDCAGASDPESYETVVPRVVSINTTGQMMTIENLSVREAGGGGVLAYDGTYPDAGDPLPSLTLINLKVTGSDYTGISLNAVDLAVVTGCVVTGNGGGGGITVGVHTSVTITGNTITGNDGGDSPTSLVSGVYISGPGAGDSIENNEISGSNNGIYVYSGYPGAPVTIRNNHIHENGFDAQGGLGNGIYILGGYGSLVANNRVWGNLGSGLYWGDSGDSFIVNNVFDGHPVAGLRMEHGTGHPTIKNNVFLNNYRGIEIGATGSIPTAVHHNCFWQNTNIPMMHAGVNPYSFGTEDPDGYGYINGPPWSEGNFLENPGFLDAAGHDYHLAASSYLIDLGTPGDAYANEPDPNGGVINVGAYGNTSEATTTPGSPSINNFAATLEPVDQEMLDLTFDAACTTERLRASLEYSTNGTDWTPGDIASGLTNGRLAPGTGKALTWNVLELFGGQVVPQLWVRLTLARGEEDAVSSVAGPIALDFSSPYIATLPETMYMDCREGHDGLTMTLWVSNSGGGTLDFSLSENLPWISLGSGGGSSSGSGDKVAIDVSFPSAAMAPGTYDGAITITAAGAANSPQSIPVTLRVDSCSYSPNPVSADFPGEGGQGSVYISSGYGECSWTAVPQQTWISITSGGSATGSASFNYSVAANTNALPRTGTIAIGSASFTINQAAGDCVTGLSPGSQRIGPGIWSGAVTVSAAAGCGWQAVSDLPWLTLPSGDAGSGPGGFQIAAGALPGGDARTANISVGSRVLTVTQFPAGVNLHPMDPVMLLMLDRK